MESEHRKFVLQREVQAIQLFGRYLIEKIPSGAVIHVSGPAPREGMMEVLWEDRQYILFERDLKDHAEPLKKPTEEDPPEHIAA